MLKIMNDLENISTNFKNWIIANGGNPLLWFGILAFFFCLFAFAFRVLKKNG